MAAVIKTLAFAMSAKDSTGVPICQTAENLSGCKSADFCLVRLRRGHDVAKVGLEASDTVKNNDTSEAVRTR